MSDADLLDEMDAANAIADALDEARAAHPEAKLVHVTDRRHGAVFVLAIPPSSPWHELLPDQQTAEILPRAAPGTQTP